MAADTARKPSVESSTDHVVAAQEQGVTMAHPREDLNLRPSGYELHFDHIRLY